MKPKTKTEDVSEIRLDYEKRINCYLSEIAALRENTKHLSKELAETKEKYSTLLEKYIVMMERCVGMIPKIPKP